MTVATSLIAVKADVELQNGCMGAPKRPTISSYMSHKIRYVFYIFQVLNLFSKKFT
jgi:hypothetical protein